MKAYDIVDVFLEVMTEFSDTSMRVVVQNENNTMQNIAKIELVEMPRTKEKVIVFKLKEEN